MSNLEKKATGLGAFSKTTPRDYSYKASQAVEDTIMKLNQVVKLRDKRYRSLDDVMEELRQKNISLYNANSDLANQLRESNLNIAKIKDNFENDKRKMIADSESEKHTLNLALASKARESEGLKGKLEDALQKNTELTKKVGSLQENLDGAISSQNEMKIIVNNLETTLEEKVRRVSSEAERKIHQVTAKSESEKRRLLALLREADAKVDDIKLEAERNVAEYKNKLEHERRRNDELSRDKDNLRQEIERLNTIVTSVQATVEQLLSEEMRLAGVYETAKDEMLEISNEYNPVENAASKYFQDSFSSIRTDDDSVKVGYIDLTSALISSAEADIVR